MVFSSSHVWMWELDHKEGWVLKNWCFQTVVLEKSLESPLESKEIKPVNPKGNQPWIFIGRIDAEAPILWPSDAKCQVIGKAPDAGKDWGKEEKGTEDEIVSWHHQLNRHEFEQTLGDGEGQGSLACCRSWGCKESDMIQRLNSSNSSPLVEMPWYSPNSGLGRHQMRLEIFFRKYPRACPKAGLWRLRKTEFSRWSQSLIPFLCPFPC